MSHPSKDIKDNFAELGAVSSKKFTVPAGKEWRVYGGTAERDVGCPFDLEVYNENDKRILQIDQIASGGNLISWGPLMKVTSVGKTPFLFPMKAGWYVKYTWGVQQVSPEVSCVVEEFEGK